MIAHLRSLLTARRPVPAVLASHVNPTAKRIESQLRETAAAERAAADRARRLREKDDTETRIRLEDARERERFYFYQHARELRAARAQYRAAEAR